MSLKVKRPFSVTKIRMKNHSPPVENCGAMKEKALQTG